MTFSRFAYAMPSQATPRPQVFSGDSHKQPFFATGEVVHVAPFHGLKKASVMMLFRIFPHKGAPAKTYPYSQVFMTIPHPVFSSVMSWLKSGARAVVYGHLAAKLGEGGAIPDFTHLVADSIEPFRQDCLAEPSASPSPKPAESVTIADLQHTMHCLQRTVEALTGPAEASTRLDVLEAVASVCVIAKGHKFSDEQRQVYAKILALMRHNGKEDGNSRKMDDAEMSRCGELWLALLALAAMRIGAQQDFPV